MSKFCTKCGRPIPEGGICFCQFQAGSSLTGADQTENSPVRQAAESRMQQMGQERVGQEEVRQQQQMGQEQVGQEEVRQQQKMGQEAVVQPQQDWQIPGSQPYPYQNQQFSGQQYKEQASAFAQNFLGKVVKVVKNPVTAGREMIRKTDAKGALLLITFQGIFSALFGVAAAGKFSLYIKALSGLADGISSGLGSAAAGALAMPYFRIFFVTILFSLALACVLALLLMAGHMVLKIPVSFPQMLSAAAIRSVVLIPAILLSIAIFELSPGTGIVLFVLINIWGFTAMILAMSGFIDAEKMDKFVLMVSVVALLFIFIAMFAMLQIWTLYLPDLIRTALKGMGGLSWSQILNKLM